MVYYPTPNSPGILWAAPFCLHDLSSGAAIQMRLIFQQLVKRGVRCHAVSALTFDAPSGARAFPDLKEQLEQQDSEWFNMTDEGVSYQYLRTSSYSVENMTRNEESKLYMKFLESLIQFKPDALFIYGGGVLEMSMVAECKRRGIATIMHVPNGNYAKYNFPNVDMLFTDTKITAANYYNNNSINIMPVGVFIDPKKVMITNKEKQNYITFINPTKEKGISLVMRLALMAKEKHPSWRFLVVENRGTWAWALEYYKQNGDDFPNVDVAKHTTDIRLVFEQTKLLLVPSLCYENFGRVTAEATMNGIPVLSSTSGGLPEAVNGGGICLEAPAKATADYSYFPLNSEMEEWLHTLEEMIDDDNYPAWQKKAYESSKIHELEQTTDNLMIYLAPLLNRRASFHPQYYIK